MNTPPASSLWACVALALLLASLIACSSASVTDTAKTEEVIYKEGNAMWSGEIRTCVNKDANGLWDTGEKPLDDVHVWFDFIEESGLIIRKDTGSATNQDGIVHFLHGGAFYLAGEHCYGFCYRDFIVRSEVPASLKRTTPDRIVNSEHQGGPHLFGFIYIDTPTSEPTASPSP